MELTQIVIDNIEDNHDTNVLKKYRNIKQIGLQGWPGLKFKINNGGVINLNKTGIFELSSDFMYISDLRFVYSDNLYANEQIKYPIYVDIIYEKEVEESEEWDSTVITIG